MSEMNEKNLFEIATRSKYRFAYRGSIGVEDLWDLSMTALDSVYKNLMSQKKAEDEESLVTAKSDQSVELENKIDIVKYIFSVKKKEADDRQKKRENNAKRQKILGILAEKQDQALRDKSPEELQAMLESMN